MSKIKKENIAIVLVEPQIPENIGSVARAMNNMGLSKLILVNPRELDMSVILKTATHNSVYILEQMDVVDDLMSGIGEYNYVVGTTARIGSRRPVLTTPRRFAKELVNLTQENKVAILFGREDRGLTNDELKLCHTILHIPMASSISLNLAQAVMVICYEIHMASIDEDSVISYVPRLANKFELEGMYEHLKRALIKIGFLDPKNPDHWMMAIRRMLSRYPLQARDVQIIRGICRKIENFVEKNKEN